MKPSDIFSMDCVCRVLFYKKYIRGDLTHPGVQGHVVLVVPGWGSAVVQAQHGLRPPQLVLRELLLPDVSSRGSVSGPAQ